jgi:hypothetical protein
MDRVSCHQGLQIGEDAGSGMTTVCALGDPAELEASLSEAGVDDVVVSEQAQAARHHDVRMAAAGQLDARSTCNFAHGTNPSG